MTTDEAINALENAAWLESEKDREAMEQAVEIAVKALNRTPTVDTVPVSESKKMMADHNGKPIAKGNLKGIALVCAIEAGMIPRSHNNKGYNIAGFMKFWDSFSRFLDETAKDSKKDID